jgi:hypothetical protein
VSRDVPGNRQLFVRVRHGYYILNPVLEVEIEEHWINVYDLIHIGELEKEQGNKSLAYFARYVREWRERAAKAGQPEGNTQPNLPTI